MTATPSTTHHHFPTPSGGISVGAPADHGPAFDRSAGPAPRVPDDRRALVLGGGGGVGNAWEIGILAGLLAAGLDVTGADLLIGTSAGSTAAAQIAGSSPADLFAAILSTGPRAAPQPRAASGRDRDHVPDHRAPSPMEQTSAIIAAAADPADMRRRMGAGALGTDTALGGPTQVRIVQERRREEVASRLPSGRWPRRRLLITAVDARTGEPVVFDSGSGVDLVDAVAASCAVGFGAFPPYRIGENRYIDGGYRRNENADLAAGCGRVLVLSPFGGRSRHPREWGMQLSTQLDELRAGGSTAAAILPDAGSREAFGTSMMDPSARPAAARAGFDQGADLVAGLAGLWG